MGAAAAAFRQRLGLAMPPAAIGGRLGLAVLPARYAAPAPAAPVLAGRAALLSELSRLRSRRLELQRESAGR